LAKADAKEFYNTLFDVSANAGIIVKSWAMTAGGG
jgi:hypothetical protein